MWHVGALAGSTPTPSKSSTSAAAYNRDLYGGWIDADGDCQNTRHEVLIAESTLPVTLDARGCRVVSGRWEDPYTGRVFTDPRHLDIDHFIPVGRGAPEWRARLDARATAAVRQRPLEPEHAHRRLGLGQSFEERPGPRPLATTQPGVPM